MGICGSFNRHPMHTEASPFPLSSPGWELIAHGFQDLDGGLRTTEVVV